MSSPDASHDLSQSDREHLINAIQDIADTFTGLDRVECALILDTIEPLIRADEREKITAGVKALQDRLQDSSLIGKLLVPTINYVLGEVLVIVRGGGLRAGGAE